MSEAHWSRNFPYSNWRRRPIEENSGCVDTCCYEGPRGGQEFETADGKSLLVVCEKHFETPSIECCKYIFDISIRNAALRCKTIKLLVKCIDLGQIVKTIASLCLFINNCLTQYATGL